jgi:ATP-binding cassette subfamily B protein
VIGERGVTLSGGQRQRMAIARTLLKNPPIIIFDDSVSAIDPETEAQIQQSLMQMRQNRTMIIISQRPSSIKYADQIVVINEGRIVQKGVDVTLRKEPGIYQDFIHAIEGQINYLDWTTHTPLQYEPLLEENQASESSD